VAGLAPGASRHGAERISRGGAIMSRNDTGNSTSHAGASATGLQVRGLAKRHGTVPVFTDLVLDAPAGQTLAVLGPSGCGKTTLLRILAGLDHADAGNAWLDGRAIDKLLPQQRQTLYLFQEPLLFPHLDVFENIAFGLRLRPQPEAVSITVNRLLVELDLEGLQRRMPDQLSGGQRQRVAFGRALAVQPKLLLLDEPFSSLDADARAAMQLLFQRVARQHRITTLFVTHDLEEALRLGDSFALFTGDRVRGFPDRASFCADPVSGVERELGFWRDIERERSELLPDISPPVKKSEAI